MPSHHGGEKIGLLRRSIEQLEDFASDADYRREIAEKRALSYAKYKQLNMDPTYLAKYAPVEIDLDDLNERIGGLADIKELVSMPDLDLADGVVFAIKFTPTQAETLVGRGGMGIECRIAIPPSSITARAIVPKNWEKGCQGDEALRTSMKPIFRSLGKRESISPVGAGEASAPDDR